MFVLLHSVVGSPLRAGQCGGALSMRNVGGQVFADRVPVSFMYIFSTDVWQTPAVWCCNIIAKKVVSTMHKYMTILLLLLQPLLLLLCRCCHYWCCFCDKLLSISLSSSSPPWLSSSTSASPMMTRTTTRVWSRNDTPMHLIVRTLYM